MAGESLVSRTRQHQHTTPQLPCLYVAICWVLALALSHPLPTPPLFSSSSFLFSLFRDCASRAKSLPSLVSIRRTDARRTQTLTRDQGNGIRDLALFPFLRTLSSFYVRFMRYVSVLYLTLTSFRFRDERRQRHHEIQSFRAVETHVLYPVDPRYEATCSAAPSTAGWPDIQRGASSAAA